MIFGLFHGLILLPVVLSIFGSDKLVREEKGEQRRRRRRHATSEDEEDEDSGMGNPAYVEEEVGAAAD